MPLNRTHERYLAMLLGHAANERYPSHHVLDRFEGAITDRGTAEAYCDVLLAQAESQRYPSLRMVDRAGRVAAQLAIADAIAARREDDGRDDRDDDRQDERG